MSSDWDDHSDLTEDEINNAKNAYGPIFRTPIEGVSYYFRTLTRADAVELGLKDGQLDIDTEEAIFSAALVHPVFVDFDNLPINTAANVTNEILQRSGLSGPTWLNKYLDRARSNQTAYHTIAATICSAFPNLLPGALDDMHIEQLCELIIQAEEILVIKARVASGSYVPLSFEEINGEGGATEMSDADRDAMVRAMLEGEMDETPKGWIDRTKQHNPAFNIYPDDIGDI